ncbi:hypothetical protein [Lysobacter gummosus]|uniref:hypothetical protein n=1 Tax=Lysobacter gummosus TaxID=262324 RepID=UPI0036410DEF
MSGRHARPESSSPIPDCDCRSCGWRPDRTRGLHRDCSYWPRARTHRLPTTRCCWRRRSPRQSLRFPARRFCTSGGRRRRHTDVSPARCHRRYVA